VGQKHCGDAHRTSHDMLPDMIEGWVLWLVVVGVAVGAAVAWLLLVRLPRVDSEVDARERRAEAAWIAATIEYHGGVAPQAFVEEVLELHQAYLETSHAGTRESAAEASTQAESAPGVLPPVDVQPPAGYSPPPEAGPPTR
jgi:hypothetical protein